MSTSIDEARTDGGHPELFNPALAYRVDATQRQVLFWATPRQRGEKYRARSSKAAPPVLDFAIELVIDRGTPKWPVNYVLVRVVPPEGTKIDRTRRPHRRRLSRDRLGGV